MSKVGFAGTAAATLAGGNQKNDGGWDAGGTRQKLLGTKEWQGGHGAQVPLLLPPPIEVGDFHLAVTQCPSNSAVKAESHCQNEPKRVLVIELFDVVFTGFLHSSEHPIERGISIAARVDPPEGGVADGGFRAIHRESIVLLLHPAPAPAPGGIQAEAVSILPDSAPAEYKAAGLITISNPARIRPGRQARLLIVLRRF